MSADAARAAAALKNLSSSPPAVVTTITEAQLAMTEFPAPRWAVPGLLPEGLTILAGAPKLGKSWLLLNIAAAIASGGFALGKAPVQAGDVLLLALEDTPRRLQERLAMIRQGGAPSERLHIATTWPDVKEGGIERIRDWLVDHPDARLLGIDVLARMRSSGGASVDRYAHDYTDVSSLKRLADEFGVAVIVVHHTRKLLAGDDPFDSISGTRGLTGAADAAMVLAREIGRSDGTLYARGRDLPEVEHALNFDPANCAWTIAGDAEHFRMSGGRADIVRLLEQYVVLRPSEIAEKLGANSNTVRSRLKRMVADGQIVEKSGTYSLPLLSGATPATPATVTEFSRNHADCVVASEIATATLIDFESTRSRTGVQGRVAESSNGATARFDERPRSHAESADGVAAVAGVAPARIIQFPVVLPSTEDVRRLRNQAVELATSPNFDRDAFEAAAAAVKFAERGLGDQS